jgi:hypothetical protein
LTVNLANLKKSLAEYLETANHGRPFPTPSANSA